MNETPAEPDHRSWRRLEVIAPAAVMTVFLVAGIVQLVGSWPAVGDFAVAELIVRHLGRHIPLSGPYSAQRGYDHPLPWIYFLLWPAYALSGGRSTTEVATAVWWNGAMAALLVWILVKRKAGGLAVVILAMLPIIAAESHRNLLVLPWNPNLGVIPAIVFVAVCWRISLGERRLLPLAAGLAVWCIGVHLEYLPFVAGLGALASLSLVAVMWRGEGRAALRKLAVPVGAALVVTALLASPAVVDLALHRRDSNPMHVIDRKNPSGEVVPADQAVKIFRADLSMPPAWARTERPYDYFLSQAQTRTPWLLAPLAVALLAAWRRKAWDEMAGMGMAFGGLAIGCLELVHMADRTLQPWYLYPAHAGSIALWGFTLWSLGRSGASLVKLTPPPLLKSAAIVAGCVAAAVLVTPSLRTPYHHQQIDSSVQELMSSVKREIPGGSRVMISTPIRYDGFYGSTIVLQMDKAGYDVRVPRTDGWLYSEAMTKAPAGWEDTAKHLVVTMGPADPTPPEAGSKLLAKVWATSRISKPQWVSIWLNPASS